MTGEGFMGVIWREDPNGVAVCSPCGIAVVWARDHEALIDVYDELAYRANGIEIARTPWPRFEDPWRVAVCETCGKLAMDREQYDAEDWQEDGSEDYPDAYGNHYCGYCVDKFKEEATQ